MTFSLVLITGLCLSAVTFDVTNSANIVIFNLAPMYSHQIALRDLWIELSQRGHNVTYFTTHPMREGKPKNMNEIDMSFLCQLLDMETLETISSATIWKLWPLFIDDLIPRINQMCLSSTIFQDMIRNHDAYRFDVVITETWFPEMLAFSKIYNCPTVQFSTIADTHLGMHYHLGNPINFVSNSDINLPYVDNLSFKERLMSGMFTLWEIYNEFFVYMPKQQKHIDQYFGNCTNASALELKQEVDLLLINSNPILTTTVRAVGPTTIFIGGGNHIKAPNLLPQDLKAYLDSAKEGFIFLSLGSNVQSKDLEQNTLNVLVDVLSKLPYKILWKYETDDFPEKPGNVKIIKWAPQQDILRHPNIKLFISQGGVQSLEETIFSHVPVLIMPFFGDQYKNGQLARSKGFGMMVQHKPRLDKLELEGAIHELISNPKYKNKAIRLAKLMNDSYMTGLEKSIWWIEYVIRNNGTKELRNPAAKLPLYQYYALDVMCFLLFIISILVLVLVVIIRRIKKLVLSFNKKFTVEKDKKL